MRSSRPWVSPYFHNFVESGKNVASLVKFSQEALLSEQGFEIGRHLPYYRLSVVLSEESPALFLQLHQRVQLGLSFIDECWA